MNTLRKLCNWYFSRKALPYWGILAMDCTIVFLSGLFVYYLQHGGLSFALHFWQVTFGLCVCLVLYVFAFFIFHTYHGVMRYSGFVDLHRVAYSTATASIGVCILHQIQVHGGFTPYLLIPRFENSLLLFIVATMLMWCLRVFVKSLHDISRGDDSIQKVFIYGCMQGGIALAKSIRNENPRRYRLRGFISTDPSLNGSWLLGEHVYLDDDNVVETMKKYQVSTLLVSPLQREKFITRTTLIDSLIKAGIKILISPAEAVEWDGKSDLSHNELREVEIEDLLQRDKIEIDMNAIGNMLRGKRILITGAAGSIGSEMSRQVAKYNPSELVLVDQAETPMHDVRLYMARNHGDLKTWTIVGSITNNKQMERIFSEHKPEYVFHAAAYKHVPMMEDNPAMAVQNNIYGTRVIADLAVKYGTKKFVMISTDKAVNPTNVMGCSKRICEIYCQALNAEVQAVQNGSSEQCSGSIVGSSGSSGSSEQCSGSIVGSNGSNGSSEQCSGSIVGSSGSNGSNGSNGSSGSKGLNGSQSIEQIEQTKSLNQTIRQNGNLRRFSNISESKGTLEAGLSDNQTGGVQVRQSLFPADSSISGICDGQHSGGVRETREQGVQELPVHSQGLLRRTEESSDESSRCELHNGRDLQSDVCGLQEAVNRDNQLHQDYQGFGIQGDKVPVGLEPSVAIEPLEPSEAIEPLEPFEPNKLRQFDGSLPVTQFVTTRFGNVLGSNGSVIPIFKEQIRKGGPVTVTHKDIIRFFMLIPEACRLVLQAGTMGHGGEIYVFDMGKPVRIADLAQRMIDLSGAKGVEIQYTGLRDGEKLYEEVLNDAEQTKPTSHPKIMVAQVREYPYSLALQNEIDLYELSIHSDDMSIVKKMKEIVPEYKSQHSKYEVLDKL